MPVSAKVATAYIELVAQTETFKKACNEAGALVKQTSTKMRADMTEAKGSIALLGEEIGVHLPRHLRTFVAELPGVSAAMSAAFSAVAVFALAKVVIETGEKIAEFAKKNEEASRKSREAWQNVMTPISDTNDKLELTKTKLENAIAKIEHKPQNKIKEAIEESIVAADELGRHLDGDIRKIAGAIAEQQRTWFGNKWLAQTFLHQTGVNAAATIASDVQDKFNQIAAGTFKADPNGSFGALYGDQTDKRDAVIRQAIADAYAKLGPAQARLAGFGANVPDTSSSAQEVRTLTELIAGLKGMLSTSSLTQDIATLQGRKAILEGVRGGAGGADDKGIITLDTDAMDVADLIEKDVFRRLMKSMPEVGLDSTQRQIDYEPLGQLENIRQMSDAQRGAVGALNELTDAFKDTASQVRDLLIRSLTEFNDTVVGIMTGDRRASFSRLGGDIARNAAKSLLEQSEGSVLQAFGFGSGGKMGTRGNPMYTKSADGPISGVSHAAGGLLGMLNDSNWFSSLFGGKLFGAGSIFGGGHALGGDVAAGVPIDVGELGRERFTPLVPGRITTNAAMGRGGPLIGYIDARGTDPALTKENFQRALVATHRQAVTDSARIAADHARRQAH